MNDIETLIFSSGGIKILSFVGSMKALSKKNLINDVKTYVGCSAGAIFAYLLNIGYTWQELYKVGMDFNFSQYHNFDIEKFFEQYGLNDGRKMINFMKALTRQKNLSQNLTFLELYNVSRIKLIISATCISDSTLEYFDYIKSPNMKVLTAVRLSMSIPYYFTTETYNGKLYVDGAVLEHIPLSLFKPSEKILALSLINTFEKKPITSLEEFTYSVFYCMRNHMGTYNPKIFNIIEIDTKKYGLLNFDIDKEQKKDLFLCGYNDTITQITCLESQKEYEKSQDNDKDRIDKNIASIEDKIKNLQEELIKEKNKLNNIQNG